MESSDSLIDRLRQSRLSLALLRHLQSSPLQELDRLVNDLHRALEELEKSETIKERLKRLLLKEASLYEPPNERALQLLHRALDSLHDMKAFLDQEHDLLKQQTVTPELKVLQALQAGLRADVTAKLTELMELKKSLR